MAAQKGDELKRAVERQSGAARALAMAMRSAAENSFIHESERQLVIDWSETIRGIGDALTRSVHSASEVRSWNRLLRGLVPAGALGVALMTGAAEGVAGSAIELLATDERVSNQAQIVIAGCNEIDAPTSVTPMEVAEAIRAWRDSEGLTQRGLAELMSYSTSTISGYETGRSRLSHEARQSLRGILDTFPNTAAAQSLRDALSN